MNKIIRKKGIADNDFEFLWCEFKALFLRKKILKELENSREDDEKKEIYEYLKKHRLSVFPYEYTSEYDLNNCIAKKDDNGLIYIQTDALKMYMKRSYKSLFRAKRYYNNILIEQDYRSPHCYITESFKPEEGDVILDIGGAEGFFPIKHIDKVKAVYIFECNDEWIEALNYTYKDYKDKVHIIDKFVSDFSDGHHISLDDFVKEYGLEHENLYIKMDAEGSEPAIIRGAKKLLNLNPNIKLNICTYHQARHEEIFRKLFKDWRVENSSGYMIYYYDFNLKKPYLRRGVLRISLQ
ncbi:MAG: FkbM family methyltransferase [Lachnospiraceae bacterium]|nr:FkbM family methyltransferase [Lachnospiraceae bacterium]